MWFVRLTEKIRTRYLYRHKSAYDRSRLAYCGSNVTLPGDCIIDGYENISVGDNTYIGPRCLFYSTEAKLTIGKDVIFGPGVSIVTGDHRFDTVGKLIRENTEKLPENDRDVTIEDDCWIGMNVNIFKGVTVGRGSVIAGGAAVVKDIPPYSIYISQDRILPRFTEEQIREHEAILKQRGLL